ncbi:hypothetical protein B566_EDAN009128 [Ephemera danica]|nr:hypothetical protein B566_EDAN009128 [Ephemera danica]
MGLRSVRWCILLLFGTCTGGTQWAEDFSKLKLQYWTSDVQYQFVHSSEVPGLQQDNKMLLEFKSGEAHLRFHESPSDVKNSNLVVNITVLGCKSKVTLNVSGRKVLLREPNMQDDCPASDRISFMYSETITQTDKLNMTLEVSGSQNSTSPTRHLLSGLEVFVHPAESNTPQVCKKHEDFSLRKLQFWENDDLGPEVAWRHDGNETLLVLNLTNLKLNPRLYFNYEDKLDAINFTFRLEIYPRDNATEVLLSDLKVTFVAKQCGPLLQPVSETKITTAANINLPVLATTENLSTVNSPSGDDDIMMWALLIGTTAALIVVSMVVAILVCYLRHSTEIKVSSPFDHQVNYSQVHTKEEI